MLAVQLGHDQVVAGCLPGASAARSGATLPGSAGRSARDHRRTSGRCPAVCAAAPGPGGPRSGMYPSCDRARSARAIGSGRYAVRRLVRRCQLSRPIGPAPTRLRPCPQGNAWKGTIGSLNGRVRRKRNTSSANGVWMSLPPSTSFRFGLVRGAISFNTAFPLDEAPRGGQVFAVVCGIGSDTRSRRRARGPLPRCLVCRGALANDCCHRGVGELRRPRDAVVAAASGGLRHQLAQRPVGVGELSAPVVRRGARR